MKKQAVLGDPHSIQRAIMAVAELRKKVPEAVKPAEKKAPTVAAKPVDDDPVLGLIVEEDEK
jgi:hypothetical protein